MKLGIQVGKHFIGYRTGGKSKKGSGMLIEKPFTENVESGMRYVVSGTKFEDIMASLTNEYTDHSLIELFASVAEIYAPIDAIASRVVAGKFFFRKRSDGTIVVDNEELNKLISSTNPFEHLKQFIYSGTCYELVTGKSFSYKNVPETLARRDFKNVVATYTLPSDKMSVETFEKVKLFTAVKVEDVIKSYVLEKGTEHEHIFKPGEILYRRCVSLKWRDKKIVPSSPLLSARRAIANLIAVYEARQVVYLKRGVMGMWVSKKMDQSGTVALTDDEKKDAREQMDSDYGLKKTKHTVGLTGAPIDFIKTSMSIQELEPFAETEADAAAIYGVLGVPFDLAPKPKGSTYANAASSERGLYQNICIPLGKSWCESLTKFWELGDYVLDVSYEDIEVLQENKKDAAEVLTKTVEAATKQYKDGAITYNEWLKAMGYPSREGDFDKYINDLENVPMAVKIGVGGTQAMQSVVADPNLSEDSKANLLVLLFGITEEQARTVVVSIPKPVNPPSND